MKDNAQDSTTAGHWKKRARCGFEKILKQKIYTRLSNRSRGWRQNLG